MRNYFGARFAALAVLGLVALGARAEAATISLNPANSVVDVLDLVSIDIMIGLGQGEVVGGANVDLTFNPAIVGGFGADNDPDVIFDSDACPSDPGFCDFSTGFGAGVYNVNLLADLALDEATLAGLQGALFRLATITFVALSPGISLLDLVNVQLSNFEGDELLVTSTEGGSITVRDVEDPAPIPEPGTIALFGAGAAVLLARRLRRARS